LAGGSDVGVDPDHEPGPAVDPQVAFGTVDPPDDIGEPNIVRSGCVGCLGDRRLGRRRCRPLRQPDPVRDGPWPNGPSIDPSRVVDRSMLIDPARLPDRAWERRDRCRRRAGGPGRTARFGGPRDLVEIRAADEQSSSGRAEIADELAARIAGSPACRHRPPRSFDAD
jgi:hypothetical protein